MEAIERDIRGFIVENFLFGEEHRTPAGKESFLELGIIDSTGVLELVQFIEDRFDVKVMDIELVPENLDTIDDLVAFVQGKTGTFR